MSKKTLRKTQRLITPKQEKFCQFYVHTQDVTESALLAGYKTSEYSNYAMEVFSQPHIKIRIKEIMAGEQLDLPLTKKQKRFAEEYMKTGLVKGSAIKAGYTEASADVSSHKLLLKPAIAAYIKQREMERAARLGLDADYVRSRLREVVERSLGYMPTIPKESRRRWNKKHTNNGKRNKLEAKYVFQPTAANYALELLGKHLAMFTDNINLKGALEVKAGVMLIPAPMKTVADWQKYVEASQDGARRITGRH